MTVVAVDRNERGLEGLPNGIAREMVDSTDPTAAAPMVERVVRDMGPPDALVNTIGAFQPDVNLGSGLWLSQAVAPNMERSGLGVIVHIAARPGIEPSAGMAAYSASKASLVHLIRILDLELRPLGIRVNGVAPQLLDTARARATFPKEVLAHAVAPEAIANVVAFLVSEEARPSAEP